MVKIDVVGVVNQMVHNLVLKDLAPKVIELVVFHIGRLKHRFYYRDMVLSSKISQDIFLQSFVIASIIASGLGGHHRLWTPQIVL